MKEIRKQRLLELLDSPLYKGDRGRFLQDSGLSKGRLSQLLDPDEPFGDVAASNLVRRLGLDDGYFDSNTIKPPELPEAMKPDLSTDVDKVMFNVGVLLSALPSKELAYKAVIRRLLEMTPGDDLNEAQKALFLVLIPFLEGKNSK